MQLNRPLAVIFVLLAGLAAGPPLLAHDEHAHTRPAVLPPIGPHGGKYAALGVHFVELTVTGSTARFYFLEPDFKEPLIETLTPTVKLEVPGAASQTLALTKDGDSYKAAVTIPHSARRVVFAIAVVIDGKTESARITYEPRR
jgi:hypothetical protein